jgi:hypothetical protein
MTSLGGISVLVTVLFATCIGYELGRTVEGGTIDSFFLVSGSVAALLVYTVTFVNYRVGSTGSTSAGPARERERTPAASST